MDIAFCVFLAIYIVALIVVPIALATKDVAPQYIVLVVACLILGFILSALLWRSLSGRMRIHISGQA